MFLIPYIMALLFVGGFVAWLCGARVRDIFIACVYIALGCFALFMLGCVHLFGLLFGPFWGIAALISVAALLALTILRIMKG